MTWRLDQVFYDAHMKYWQSPTADDIVIIAIDEQSLREYGRWPWTRNIHTLLLEQLTEGDVRAVVFDIIFAEPSTLDPAADQLLANAISHNGKVFLPVLMEQNRLRGQLIETLPIPILAQAAAGLGNVHIELDQDGIARSAFLKEGLGSPHWSNINLALFEFLSGHALADLPGLRNSNIEIPFNTWSRDYQVLIPYAGPPGHFNRISYSQVLSRDFSPALLKDKIVFVGATATGIGDVLPTPVSGQRHAMPGVEINANLFQAIRNNKLVVPIALQTNYWVYFLAILLPIFLYPLFGPRNAMFMAIALVGLVMLLSILMLRAQQLWLPPMSAMLTILASYPLWSWRRMEFTIKSLNEELDLLNDEKSNLNIDIDSVKQAEFEMLGRILLVNRMELLSPSGVCIAEFKTEVEELSDSSIVHKTQFNVELDDYALLCQLSSVSEISLTEEQQKVVDEFVKRVVPAAKKARTTVEIIEQRVSEVKDTTIQLRHMQQFVRDSLEQMPEGIVLINQYGTIININRKAYELLQLTVEHSLQGQHVLVIKDELELSLGQDLVELIISVLVTHKARQMQIEREDFNQILVNISPFFDYRGMLIGLILSLTDISEITRQQKQKEELINFLSHDLRTPLVSSLARIDMARSKIPQPDEWSDWLNKQQKLNQKTLNLAEEFVQLTRAENLNAYDFKPLNLIDVVDNAIDSIWSLAEAKNMEISNDYKQSFIEVSADFDLLERVVQNLLSNAIKYSPDNTCVSVTIGIDNSRPVLCVNDQGYGINVDDMMNLFSRFKRFNNVNTKTEGGVGLGLVFVKTTLDKHNAEIIVSSELNKGSQFCVYFPDTESYHTAFV